MRHLPHVVRRARVHHRHFVREPVLYFHQTTISIGYSVVALVSLLIGQFVARVLLTTQYSLFDYPFSLNLGPFSIKEHVLIGTMTACNIGTVYAVEIVILQKIFYKDEKLFIADFALAGSLQIFLVRLAEVICYRLPGYILPTIGFLSWSAGLTPPPQERGHLPGHRIERPGIWHYWARLVRLLDRPTFGHLLVRPGQHDHWICARGMGVLLQPVELRELPYPFGTSPPGERIRSASGLDRQRFRSEEVFRLWSQVHGLILCADLQSAVCPSCSWDDISTTMIKAYWSHIHLRFVCVLFLDLDPPSTVCLKEKMISNYLNHPTFCDDKNDRCKLGEKGRLRRACLYVCLFEVKVIH